MRSGANVRSARNEWFADTHLIVDYRIADIFNQTADFIHILDIVEKTFNFPLLGQWLEFSDNAFQFPEDPPSSDSDPDLEECELTVPVSLSPISPLRPLQKQVRKASQKRL